MRKIILITFLFHFSLGLFCQDINIDSNNYYLKYVYTITILNKEEQTAFKIKGYNGLVTSLHGFYFLTESGKNFEKYKISEIKNFKGERIYYYKEYTEKSLTVQKVDLARDIAFIPYPMFDKNEGFVIGNIESLNFGSVNGKMFNCGNVISNEIIGITVELYNVGQTFSDQILDTNARNYYSRLQIPSLGCKIIAFKSCLFYGNSGSPIVNSKTYELLAIANGNNNPNWSWGIIPEMDSLVYYNQLSKKQRAILDSAYNRHIKQQKTVKNSICQTSKPKLNFSDCKPIKKGGKDFYPVYRKYDTTLYFKQYKPLVIKASYPFIKTIPKAYNFYLETGCNEDIKRIDNRLNAHKRDGFVSKHIANNLKKIKEKNKKYELSRSFVSVLRYYSEYLEDPTNDSIYDILIAESNRLKKINDTSTLTRNEQKQWKKAKLDYYEEVESLLNQISKERLIPSKILDSLNDPPVGDKYKHENGDSSQLKKEELELQKNNECYNSYIEKADKQFSDKEYKAAYQNYDSASNCMPNKEYPKIKKAEIESNLKEKIFEEKVNNIGRSVGFYFNQEKSDYIQIFKLPKLEYSFIKPLNINDTFRFFIKFGMSEDDFRLNSLYTCFPTGKYIYFEGNKAIEIISHTIREIYKGFGNIINDSAFKIKIVGNADGIPFTGKLKYNYDFGNIDYEIVKDEKDHIYVFKDLINGNSNDKNRALAFLRAYNLKYILETEHSFLKNKVDVLSLIHKEKGGDYRYVQIGLKFKVDKNKLQYFDK